MTTTTARPTAIEPGDARHGTRAGYIAGCRADCCREPHLRYQKMSSLRRLREGSQWVEPDRTLARLARWADYGVSPHAVGVAAGLCDATVLTTVRQHRRVLRSTERAIMSVRWDDLDPAAWCYADLTRLRIYSAQASGHHQRDILAAVTGAPRTGQWRTQERVSIGLARAIQAVYDNLPAFGPARHSASRARNAGWPVMAAWDDPGMPAAPKGWRPSASKPVHRGNPGRHHAEEAQFLADLGLGLREVCERLGVSVEGLRVALKRADRSDLYWTLGRRDGDFEKRRDGRRVS